MISTAMLGPLYVSLAQRKLGLALDALGSARHRLRPRRYRQRLLLGRAVGPVEPPDHGAGRRAGRACSASPCWRRSRSRPALTQSIGFYAAVLFILNISHAGVRIGRKTHVVDIGGGHKAEYVALSNSIIGVLLLVVGGLLSALMALSGLELAAMSACCRRWRSPARRWRSPCATRRQS